MATLHQEQGGDSLRVMPRAARGPVMTAGRLTHTRWTDARRKAPRRVTAKVREGLGGEVVM